MTRYICAAADYPSSVSDAGNNAREIFVDTDTELLQFYDKTNSLWRTLVTTAQTQTLTGKTLTAPTITAPTITGTGTIGAGMTITTPLFTDLTEVVAATNVITAAESGSVFFLNSATEFVSTLPAPAAGLHFTFIVTAAPSGASYTVICAAAGTLIIGGVVCSQDAGGSADSGVTGEGTLTFVDGKAVKGDFAEFWCDGTNWFVRAQSKVFDAITIS